MDIVRRNKTKDQYINQCVNRDYSEKEIKNMKKYNSETYEGIVKNLENLYAESKVKEYKEFLVSFCFKNEYFRSCTSKPIFLTM